MTLQDLLVQELKIPLSDDFFKSWNKKIILKIAHFMEVNLW